MKPIVLTLLAATFALAGCAVDPTSQDAAENQDGTQQASTGDRANDALASPDVGIGGRAGIAIADDPGHRLYDFDTTPRIGQRSPYDVSLAEINAIGAVPHAATSDGNDVERRQEANVGTSGPKP
jgi:hypothetical protein